MLLLLQKKIHIKWEKLIVEVLLNEKKQLGFGKYFMLVLITFGFADSKVSTR